MFQTPKTKIEFRVVKSPFGVKRSSEFAWRRQSVSKSAPPNQMSLARTSTVAALFIYFKADTTLHLCFASRNAWPVRPCHYLIQLRKHVPEPRGRRLPWRKVYCLILCQLATHCDLDGMPPHSPILRRRNGKLQSCEPCRISKIRCDHRSPVCSRCIARGTEKGCTYHPAPLTKPPRKPTDVLTEATGASLSVLSSPAASRNGSGHTPADTEAEFLGSTCFSAVIEDDKDVVDLHTGQVYNRRFLPDIDKGSNSISEEQIVAGIDVLKLFLEQPDMVALIQRAYDLNFTYMVPRSITMACATSIHGIFHGPAVKPGKKQLRRLVLSICENTYKPLALFPSIRAKDYHTLFTGPNLRWEIVGYILALLGRALQFDLKRGAEIHSTSSRKEAWRSKAHRLLEAVGYCSTICDSGNSVSHQSLWLLYGEAHLKNVVFGDMGQYNHQQE
jgi:hypothetical protein